MMCVAAAAILALLVSGPTYAQPEPAPAKAGVSRYACPMKCEADKSYAEPGKCPVCGMSLKGIAAPGYSLRLASAGGPPKGNEATVFNLRLLDPAGAPVGELESMDGKKLHVYIALRDLAWLEHFTPEQDESGAFRFEATLPPGEFVLYTAFTPASAGPQTVSTMLSASGKPANPRALGVDADRPRTVDGLTVSIDGYQGATEGKPSTLTFHIGGDASGITEMSPGTPADVVLISHDRLHLIRPTLVADRMREGELDFKAQWPAPGLYRAWIRLKRADKVSTAAFNFEVTPAERK